MRVLLAGLLAAGSAEMVTRHVVPVVKGLADGDAFMLRRRNLYVEVGLSDTPAPGSHAVQCFPTGEVLREGLTAEVCLALEGAGGIVSQICAAVEDYKSVRAPLPADAPGD